VIFRTFVAAPRRSAEPMRDASRASGRAYPRQVIDDVGRHTDSSSRRCGMSAAIDVSLFPQHSYGTLSAEHAQQGPAADA